MNSLKSYLKFQKFYEFVLPIIGLSSLFAWDGDIKLKIPLAIILYRSCFNWSELAALEKGAQERHSTIRSLLDSEEKKGVDVFESKASSWASMIGLLIQILVTIGVSALIAQLL